MESTGVYWKPVINILEPAGFTLLVVNAQHIKYVPGHKTDKKDSAWICKLLRAGLLKGSFIPDRVQRDLRDLTCYRRRKVQEVTAEAPGKGTNDPEAGFFWDTKPVYEIGPDDREAMTVATSTRMKVPFLLGRFTYIAFLYAASSTQVPAILLSVYKY